MRFFFFVFAFVLIACGDDRGSRDTGDIDADAAVDTASDTATSDTFVDSAPDTGAPGDCASTLVTNTTFEAARGFRRSQVQPDLAFDGEKFWIAMTVDEGGDSSLLDIYGVLMQCDGSVDAPFMVNTTSDNDIDGTVAIGSSRAMFVWQSDDGSGSAGNLDVRVRAYELSGEAVGDDRLVVTQLDGAAFTGSMWMAEIAPMADGFVVAGSRGVESRSAFNAFAQRIDADGASVGATEDLFPENVGQLEPSVAATSEGTIHVAWNASLESDQAMHLEVGSESAARVLEDALASGSPDIAIDPAHPERRLIAAYGGGPSDTDIFVVDVGAESQPRDSVGALGRLDLAPQIALGEDGGAIVYLRNVRGIRNELFVAHFDYDGTTLAIDAPVEIATREPVATYVPGIVHVSDDRYAIVWSEGISPAFKVMVRVVER